MGVIRTRVSFLEPSLDWISVRELQRNWQRYYGLKRKKLLLAGEGKRGETDVLERRKSHGQLRPVKGEMPCLSAFWNIYDYSVSCSAISSPSTYMISPLAPSYQLGLSVDPDIPLRPIRFMEGRLPIHPAGRATLDSVMKLCKCDGSCCMISPITTYLGKTLNSANIWSGSATRIERPNATENTVTTVKLSLNNSLATIELTRSRALGL